MAEDFNKQWGLGTIFIFIYEFKITFLEQEPILPYNTVKQSIIYIPIMANTPKIISKRLLLLVEKMTTTYGMCGLLNENIIIYKHKYKDQNRNEYKLNIINIRSSVIFFFKQKFYGT